MELKVSHQPTGGFHYSQEIDNGNWEKMSTLGSAMPGTDIACTVFKTSEPKIR
jgi:hypothetical protein